MQTVETLEEVEIPSALHPRRRVVVLLRDDGLFAWAEQYHYVSEHDGEVIVEGWHSLAPEGIYASAEIAAAEGRAAMLDRLGGER